MTSQSHQDKEFPDGAALVIGGSGGIGAGICRCLAERGVNVVLTYRSNRAAAERAAESVRAAGAQAAIRQLELTDPVAVAEAVQSAAAEFHRLHTVVLAVGADISMSYVGEVSTDEWMRTIDGDLNGSFHVIKAALPLMRKTGGGSFVALTSAGLSRHAQKDILSIVPKAGVEALMRGVAREEGRYGIRANSVALGVIDGGLFDRIRERVDGRFIEAMKSNTALRRFGTVREAAETTVFLASSKAGFITDRKSTRTPVT